MSDPVEFVVLEVTVRATDGHVVIEQRTGFHNESVKIEPCQVDLLRDHLLAAARIAEKQKLQIAATRVLTGGAATPPAPDNSKSGWKGEE